MGAIIHFADGQKLNVNESVDEIQNAITSIEPGITPMIRLTEFGPSNQPALVLATNIVSVQDLG
jgi:hypothetical protein